MRLMVLAFFLVAGTQLMAGEADDVHQRNARIGRGINLGNALEAPTEGAWGVRLEEAYFRKIAEAGFDSVRIPARWSAHAADEAPYTIDKSFFERVDWAVRQALDNDLVVVLNIHHYQEITEAPADHKARFLGLWRQIAEHYRDYPADLYLELLNEPCNNLGADLWNEYAAEAIALIRESNPSRTLVVGSVSYNKIQTLNRLKVPAEDRNLIVTFHSYEPFQFTHQGASWVGEQSQAWLGTTWEGTEEQKAELTNLLDMAARWSKDNDRPLFMGEFGAYERADLASRARYTAFMTAEAERRGFSWAYWEFCSGFGAYDATAGTWRKELLAALIPDTEPED